MVNKNKFILLAEDDEDDQELIRLAFEQAHSEFSLKIAENGQEALDILSKEQGLPTLIILDLNMPLLNGLDALKEMNKQFLYSTIPKIILTTSDAADNRKAALSNGAVDYFVKPSTMADFVSTAKKILTYCS